MKNHIISSIALATLSVNASSILVDLGTASTVTQAQAGANQTNQVLNAVNDSATYLFGALNDDSVSWDATAGGIGKNNTSGITGSQVRITLTSFTGTGSITIDPRNPTAGADTSQAGAARLPGTFDAVTSGDVGAFTLRLEYLNSTGGALGMSGANKNNINATPMLLIGVRNGEATTLNMGLLDAGNNLITGMDYIPSASSAVNNVNPTTVPSANGGIAEYTLAASANNTGSFHRFNDSTSTPTGANRADDFFSGFQAELIPDDGTFADGTRVIFSVDGRILTTNGVVIPEPSSSALLALALVGLISYRKRSLISHRRATGGEHRTGTH